MSNTADRENQGFEPTEKPSMIDPKYRHLEGSKTVEYLPGAHSLDRSLVIVVGDSDRVIQNGENIGPTLFKHVNEDKEVMLELLFALIRSRRTAKACQRSSRGRTNHEQNA